MITVTEWVFISGGLALAVFLIIDHLDTMFRGRSCMTKEGRKVGGWEKWEQGIYYGVIVALLVFNLWWVIEELT